MSEELRATALAGRHTDLGAHFTDFAGWSMPLRYSGPGGSGEGAGGSGGDLAEHRAVREAAGVFDLSHMGRVSVAGPDAAALLDRALVGEISKVAVGRAKYSLLCNESGGVLDDLITYRLADDDFLVVPNAANTAVAVECLSAAADGGDGSAGGRHPGLDAQVRDLTADNALIAVQGPASREIVAGVLTADDAPELADLKYYAAMHATLNGTVPGPAGARILVARTGYTGEDGFELYLPNAGAPALWDALVAVARERGGLPAGLACRDTLRLEAGMGLYGHELTTETTPIEAGMGRMIRPAKASDYTGRAVLEELRAEQEAGRYPQRTLVGLTGTGRRAARAGYLVIGGGEQVGEVTSGVLSPTLGHPIALAYVDVGHCEPGTELTVDVRGKHLPFTVVTPPFYTRG